VGKVGEEIMADIYTGHRPFIGQLIGVGEPPDNKWDKTYGKLGFRVLEQLMDDHTGDRKFMWNYCKRDDTTPDEYWKLFSPCPTEITAAVRDNHIELWWYVFASGKDERLWEEVKGRFLKAVNGHDEH